MEQLAMCYECFLPLYSGILYLITRRRPNLNQAFKQLKLFVSMQTDQPHIPRVYTHLDTLSV